MIRFDRRRFLAATALAGPLSRAWLAEAHDSSAHSSRPKQALLKQVLSAPPIGFPTLTPTFAAMFTPGAGPIQLVRSETWAGFMAETETQSHTDYVLSALTSIQNLNRTWFYGAFRKGAGPYQLLRTPDPKAFVQMFNQLQNTHSLVDFDVAWELGQIYYSGYWLANAPNSKPAGQALLWDLDGDTFGSQWDSLSSNGMRMTRIQVYPQDSGAAYSALFVPGTDSYIYWLEPADAFFNDVTAKFAGSSLVGIAFDPTSGNMAGCWRDPVTPSQFVFNRSWDDLTAAAEQASAGGMVLSAMAAYPNAPAFDDFFETNEAPFVEGYAYAVALNGQVIANGGGFARSSHEPRNPGVRFTADTRLNIASVSKAVTGIALEVLLLQTGISLDMPFWPLIESKVPLPHPSVKTVTLRNLATMLSGLLQEEGEGPLGTPDGYSDIWGFLNDYLSHALAGTPGVTYYYDNTNFTILQGVVEQVSGMSYVDYVTKYVLAPAGIDARIFNATPDADTAAALQYSGPQDTRPGNYWGPFDFVAPGGWIASARELIKILIAMRGTSVLPANTVTEMFNDLIGWDSEIDGNFGKYYAKNGGLGNGLTPPQQLNTCLVRLGEGYDIALIANSQAPVDVVTQCVAAFESRGAPLASEPADAPSLTTVVHAATLLPACAPGSYASIIGSGFPGPVVSWAPKSNLPTELNGVEVRVGTQYAYIAYVDPSQVNFLLPSSVPVGVANVELTTPQGGMTSSIEIHAIAPGLFAYLLNGKSYPAALFAGTSEVVAAVGAFAGLTTRPAAAGDVIELYGTGMGPTNPTAPDGVVFTRSYPASRLAAFKVTIGGKAATVSSAELVEAGLFQVNVQIPSGLSGGDQPVTLTVNNIAAQANLWLTI